MLDPASKIPKHFIARHWQKVIGGKNEQHVQDRRINEQNQPELH